MNPRNIPYHHFENYVLRSPLFSIDFYKSITQKQMTSDAHLKTLINNDQRIKEAIFLASPTLTTEINKWLDNRLDAEKSEKIHYTVLKYLSRMSSRCTPFGLFAGTTVGHFNDYTNIELKKNHKHKRNTRLDMNYLASLCLHLSKTESIRDQLRFFPNTSLYRLGHQFRYIEYSYINTRRVHHIIGIDFNEYVDKIISLAKTGKTINELAVSIVDEEISLEDAKEFITELTENQILISELEPTVSGDLLSKNIIDILKPLKGTKPIVSILEEVDRQLEILDTSLPNHTNEYLKISELLKPLDVPFDIKYLFQTDMVLAQKENTLSQLTAKKITKTLKLLNKLSSISKKTAFNQFQEAFIERYETKSVPLSRALDKELGIGYSQNNDYGDVNPLIGDLNIPTPSSTTLNQTINTNIIETILHKKVVECLTSNSTTIQLKDNDFEDITERWDDLPDTMSSMVEIYNLNGKEKVYMNYAAGSSAVNLLGRFCHGDSNIEDHVNHIIEVENKMNKDKILAEIVHLPEARAGNILFRPHLRDYEIPYLANSTMPSKNQIRIDDLAIVADSNNRIKIMSKKHSKEIVPRLSNAHNYAFGLPVYQFLASSQNSGKRNVITFDWGNLIDKFDFLPRVEYNDIILSYKLWNINKEAIQPLVNSIANTSELRRLISEFKTDKKLPDLVMLKDGDNELLINLCNIPSVKMLLHTVKKRPGFQLKEFLHSDGIVKESAKRFSNQVIVSFYNEHKLNQKTND